VRNDGPGTCVICRAVVPTADKEQNIAAAVVTQRTEKRWSLRRGKWDWFNVIITVGLVLLPTFRRPQLHTQHSTAVRLVQASRTSLRRLTNTGRFKEKAAVLQVYKETKLQTVYPVTQYKDFSKAFFPFKSHEFSRYSSECNLCTSLRKLWSSLRQFSLYLYQFSLYLYQFPL